MTRGLTPEWRDYARAVYHDDRASSVDPHGLQLLYSEALIASRPPRGATSPCFRSSGAGYLPCAAPPAWASALVLPRGSSSTLTDQVAYKLEATRTETLLLHNNYHVGEPSWNRSDHSWVEVTRWAGSCTRRRDLVRGDGSLPPCHCFGLPNCRCSARGRSPIGCFFWIASGSGVFVNVGRSLRARTRAEVTRILSGALGRGVNASAGRDTLRGRVMVSGVSRPEDAWCGAALASGWDSIQVGPEEKAATPKAGGSAGGGAKPGSTSRAAEAAPASQHPQPLRQRLSDLDGPFHTPQPLPPPPRSLSSLVICRGPCQTEWYLDDPCHGLP